MADNSNEQDRAGQTEDTNKCDEAVIAAFKSIENCCIYKKWYDAVSLENFRSRQKQFMDILEEVFEEKHKDTETSIKQLCAELAK